MFFLLPSCFHWIEKIPQIGSYSPAIKLLLVPTYVRVRYVKIILFDSLFILPVRWWDYFVSFCIFVEIYDLDG
jgi:hypothetical protein